MSRNTGTLKPGVSPAAKKLAEELGIDVRALEGSAALLAADDEKKLSSEGGRSSCGGYRQKVSLRREEGCPKIKVRRLMARTMEAAWKSIPHFYVTVAVNMTEVVGIRHEYGATINDFVMAATARALVEHPWVNATWNGEQGVELPDVNIAMAAATDRGLFYPVLHNCDQLTLKQIGEASRGLAELAGECQLGEENLANPTFTVTNMGMMGVESFGAIITPPQAAVLSVGSVKGEVIVDERGEPAVALMMRLTLSADHRVLDGTDAAEFLDTLRCYLEAPVMLVDD